MKPSEVRRHVLDDHSELRDMLVRLEALARDERNQTSDTLRLAGEALLERLATHMRWEDRYLGPAVREADGWGDARAALLAEDHREQREILGYALAQLRDGSRPKALVAVTLLDLVEMLRKDMEEEEAALLDPSVLRDDVVSIDTETG